MDGPFASLYPWNESMGLNSLSSAKWSPFSKTCKTWEEANELLDGLSSMDVERQVINMRDSMAEYYPAIYNDYEIVSRRRSIRAMPKSGADSRLVNITKEGNYLCVRAGKIDAVIHTEKEIFRILGLGL